MEQAGNLRHGRQGRRLTEWEMRESKLSRAGGARPSTLSLRAKSRNYHHPNEPVAAYMLDYYRWKKV